MLYTVIKVMQAYNDDYVLAKTSDNKLIIFTLENENHKVFFPYEEGIEYSLDWRPRGSTNLSEFLDQDLIVICKHRTNDDDFVLDRNLNKIKVNNDEFNEFMKHQLEYYKRKF